MSLHFEIQENKILLHGNTFAIKERIKEMGGRWNAQEKHWWLSMADQTVQDLQSIGFCKLHRQSDLAPNPGLSLTLDDAKLPSLEAGLTNTSALDVAAPCLKISEFIALIQSVIKKQLNQHYWISGEISSFKLANGHLFFDLIEKDDALTGAGSALRAASIPCILWAGRKKMLQNKLDEIPLADGTQIKICVNVDFRKEGARILAIVSDFDTAHTQGNLLLQRQAIVHELKRRQLYHKNKSASLPFFPLRLALITAENSRASADFLNELKLSQIHFQLTLFDCNMQGENTSRNVVQAFQQIAQQTQTPFDAVVVTRGGGSRLDLRWFDDLEIAKQIAYCNRPVITAVGHFDDISIADEVSFHSEKTPTAAARFLVTRVQNTLTALFTQVDNLGRVLLRRFEKEQRILCLMEEKIAFHATRRLQAEKKQLERLEQFFSIFAVNLEKTLLRGFAVAYGPTGKLLTAKDFTGDNYPKNFEVQFASEPSKLGTPQRLAVRVQVQDVHTIDATAAHHTPQETL